ncbi:PQQ-binding-like beta-propeller repeat protein [Dactylosporangium sp. CS-033363]|uniref:outer membrane protein assembly factor BamB family protein n=1 Tax=Dactylosporangium sp. CS-033363 TaxID=3239935 RepID=UPI003D8D55F9
MSVIDLGAAEPWSPPDGPPRGSRRGRAWRRVAAVAVAVLAAGLLVSAGAAGLEAPLFSLEDRVLDARLAGGMVFVTRYQVNTLGQFEGRSVTGQVLWTRPRARDTEDLQLLAGGVVVISSVYGDLAAQDGAVTVLDARTGAELWRRPAVAAYGRAGDRLVLQDVRGWTERWAGSGREREKHLLGVDLRTGATRWERTLPGRSLVSLGYRAGTDDIGSIDELTADGKVVRRDPGSGAETARWPLGVPADEVNWFDVYGDRAVVSRIGVVGVEVYDGATGLVQWRYGGVEFASVYPCTAGHWCAVDGGGIHALDAASGREVWGVGMYNTVFGADDDIVVAGGLGTSASPSHETVVFPIDARTGKVGRRLDGWVGAYGRVGRRQIVAHTDPGQWYGVVGLYDPRTGGVQVVGRGQIGPTPRCTAADGVVLCSGNGLNVWRLP